jgi:hypothetical protein
VTAQAPVRRSYAFDWRREWTDDARQLVAVLLVALIAVAIGYGIKVMATTSTRTVTAGNVTAQIPTNWIFQPGAQDLLFTAADPRNPGQRYSVSRSSVPGTDLTAVADSTVAGKSQFLREFQVLNRSTVQLNGKDAPSVTYAYVTTRNANLPQVIQGRDTFVSGSGGALIVTFESPARSFDSSLSTFERFAASVKG